MRTSGSGLIGVLQLGCATKVPFEVSKFAAQNYLSGIKELRDDSSLSLPPIAQISHCLQWLICFHPIQPIPVPILGHEVSPRAVLVAGKGISASSAIQPCLVKRIARLYTGLHDPILPAQGH